MRFKCRDAEELWGAQALREGATLRPAAARRALKFVERLGQGYLWFGGPIAVLLLVENAALRRDASTLLAAMVLDLAVIATLKACTPACARASSRLSNARRGAGYRAPPAAAVQYARYAGYQR